MKKLSSLGKVLNKVEQRKILGGEDSAICAIWNHCTLFIRELNAPYPGECNWQLFGRCYCYAVVDGQGYATDPNTTSMCDI